MSYVMQTAATHTIVSWRVLDQNYVSFVAKVQRAKTRRDKEYFILRVTIPKQVAKQMGVQPGDYLLLRVKKAMWYHMLDWKEMEATWRMLPEEIKREIILAGLPNPSIEGPVAAAAQPFDRTTLTAPGGLTTPHPHEGGV
jgi:hypothetical protein